MNPIAKRQATLGIALGVAAALHAVVAQDAPASAAGPLEEITVTATRRSESLQSVPISITAMSGDALDDAGVTQTRDLVGLTPNLSQQGSFARTSPSFFIRGIGSTQFNPNANSKVGVYLDDVYLASPAVHGSQIFDVASVERSHVVRRARCSARTPRPVPCASSRLAPRLTAASTSARA
ncbi:MAG: Plug domain-containing protein [Proteobacteria bacterium]|nr:Plug domain-containing protein [Pseudomonadota bacterium]